MDTDLFTLPAGAIAEARPLLTMVDGRPVFREL
jgi:predicted amidohydrolase YtcJ